MPQWLRKKMNTGSGLHLYSVTQSCATLWHPMDYNLPTSLLCSGNFPGKNTWVDCHFLFQGIFPTQGSKPHLLHWQADSLALHHLNQDDSPKEGNGSPLQYSCHGKPHGQRNLAGYSPQDSKRVGYNLATKKQQHGTQPAALANEFWPTQWLIMIILERFCSWIAK